MHIKEKRSIKEIHKVSTGSSRFLSSTDSLKEGKNGRKCGKALNIPYTSSVLKPKSSHGAHMRRKMEKDNT